MTLDADEILGDLEVSRADPGPGYLERLFLRFNDRVPFETASKIVRHAHESDPAAKPRVPEIFWEDRLGRGAGGTCFARVAAFEALLNILGFRVRRVLGRVRSDFDHAALLVDIGASAGRGESGDGAGTWICDVGFPLPALLPARAGGVDTALGALAVVETARGWRVDFEEGVPAGPRSVEIFGAAVPEGEYLARWRETFRADSKFLTEVSLHRLLDNRHVAFTRGALRIDDRHSRTLLPLAADRAQALEESFGVDADLLTEAFALAGDPDPESPNASVEVFLESPAPAAAAYSAIATPEGWEALHSGVAEVSCAPTGPRSWSARFAAPGDPAGGFTEDVSADDAARRVSVRRNGRGSSWSVDERDGRTYLIRHAVLDGPRVDLVRNDSLRGRFAGSLAIDLLAWARAI